MTFKITELPESRRVNLELGKLDKITVRGIRQAFYQIGVLSRQKINRDVLAKPRGGKITKFRGRRHTASLPGESFANRSGNARRKRGFNTVGANFLEFGFRQDGETIYTKILEEVGGRPTVGNASKFLQGRAQNIMQNELKKAHDEGFK